MRSALCGWCWQLERAQPHTVEVRPATPTQSRELLLKLLNLELQARPPASGIVSVTLEAEPAQPQTAQRGLFQSQFPDPEKLELLLARAAGDYRRGRVWVRRGPALTNMGEDVFAIEPFRPHLEEEQTEQKQIEEEPAEPSGGSPSRLALRTFRPPQIVRVLCWGNEPRCLFWQGAKLAIAAAAGPWHTSGSWWNGHAWDADFWDVGHRWPHPLAAFAAGSWLEGLVCYGGSMTERYVELHARSAFSFLEGASLPEALTEQAAHLELPGLAILDRDGLYGSPRLYTSAKKLGLRSHIGAEVSVETFGAADSAGDVAASHDSRQAGTAVAALRVADRLPESFHVDLRLQTCATQQGRRNCTVPQG